MSGFYLLFKVSLGNTEKAARQFHRVNKYRPLMAQKII